MLRKACERTWERHALRRNLSMDFATLFQDLLAQFDTQPDNFSPQRVQDELVGQMAELLEADYDTLSLEIDDSESRQRALTSDPAPLQAARPAVPAGPPRPPSPPSLPPGPSVQSSEPGPGQAAQAGSTPAASDKGMQQDDERLQGHIVSRPRPPNACNPSSAWWPIRWATSCPTSRPTRCARSLCRRAGSTPSRMSGTSSPAWMCRIGCGCTSHSSRARSPRKPTWPGRSNQRRRHGLRLRGAPAVRALPPFACAVLTLLHALCAAPRPAPGFDGARLADDLAALLHGGGAYPRLSDAGLVKLFRLLRMARRLLDLETGAASSNPGHGA